MTDKSDIRDQFILAITRLANRYAVLAKTRVDFGTGEKLSPAEIHTIDAIGKHDGINLTVLSNLFGITPGAVSQMLRKLEKRGYIMKSQHPANWKEIRISLTEKGKIAFTGHESFHREMDADILKEIETVSHEQIEDFLTIMKKIGDQIEKYIGRGA